MSVSEKSTVAGGEEVERSLLDQLFADLRLYSQMVRILAKVIGMKLASALLALAGSHIEPRSAVRRGNGEGADPTSDGSMHAC